MDTLEADVKRVFHERRDMEKAARSRCVGQQQQHAQTQTDAHPVRRVLFVERVDS